jgi:hypothetical protein
MSEGTMLTWIKDEIFFKAVSESGESPYNRIVLKYVAYRYVHEN